MNQKFKASQDCLNQGEGVSVDEITVLNPEILQNPEIYVENVPENQKAHEIQMEYMKRREERASERERLRNEREQTERELAALKLGSNIQKYQHRSSSSPQPPVSVPEFNKPQVFEEPMNKFKKPTNPRQNTPNITANFNPNSYTPNGFTTYPNTYTPNAYTPKLPSPKLPLKNRSPSPPAPGLPPPLPPQKSEVTNFPPPPAKDRHLSDDDALLAFLSQDKRADTPNYKKSSRSNSIQKPGVGGGTDYSTLPPPVSDLKENTSPPQVSPGTRVSGISAYQQAKRHVVKPYQPPTQPTPKQQSIFSTQPTYTPPEKVSLVEPLKTTKHVNFISSSSATNIEKFNPSNGNTTSDIKTQLSNSKGQISTNDGNSPGEVARTDPGFTTFKDRQKMFQGKINSNNPNLNSTEMNKRDDFWR